MPKDDKPTGRVLAPVDDYPEKKDDIQTEEEQKAAVGYRTPPDIPDYAERYDLSTEDVDMAEVEELKRQLIAEQAGLAAEAVVVQPAPVVEEQVTE